VTREELRDELARIADGAPVVDVPHDLYARGRRANWRARGLVVAAVAACIAAVAAVTVPVLTAEQTEVTDEDGSVGVPDRIYAPPDGDVTDLPLLALDEVGPLVATYQVDTRDGDFVVITRDGFYSRVRLPHHDNGAVDAVSPSLSPDGRQLAYGSVQGDVRGLTIVDLTTGDLRDVLLVAPLGAAVFTLQWSPDSSRLAWSGQAVSSASGTQVTFRSRTIAGIVGPDSSRSRLVSDVGGGDWGGLGVCDDGTPLRFVWPAFLAYGGGGRNRFRSWDDLTLAHGACSAPATFNQLAGSGALLGWLPPGPGDPGPTAVAHLRNDRLVLQAPDGTQQRVGTAESAWVKNLSVATTLMTAERPTVPAVQSPWHRSWLVEHWLALLSSVAIGGVIILVVVRARAVRR